MYALWGYLLKAKALAPINAGRVLEGGWYLKLHSVAGWECAFLSQKTVEGCFLKGKLLKKLKIFFIPDPATVNLHEKTPIWWTQWESPQSKLTVNTCTLQTLYFNTLDVNRFSPTVLIFVTICNGCCLPNDNISASFQINLSEIRFSCVSVGLFRMNSCNWKIWNEFEKSFLPWWSAIHCWRNLEGMYRLYSGWKLYTVHFLPSGEVTNKKIILL